MQTTLLGIAIVVILALIAALVGPHFIDWNQYRAEFETQASHLTGLSVRIAGPIEARILPTPALTLQKIEIAPLGDADKLRARSLSIEFALGALMRGEWRASEVRLEGPNVVAGLDASGHLEWPMRAAGIDLDAISIERLEVVDGRATLSDAASGTHVVLEKFEFKGELRTLAGPVKGEGAFLVAGQHYPYRVTASRVGEDGGVRVHLNIDPIDRPLIADIDTYVFVEHGVPRFDGNLQLARPVGRAGEGIIEPWHVASHIKGDSAGAVFEQIEFQYGPDERAINLRGDANLEFGGRPQLHVGLGAAQVDIDRMLALPEAERRHPLAAIKTLADYFGGTRRMPIPVTLGISIENATLAGATLQRLSGEIRAGADSTDSWDVRVLEFRAPGATQVRLSGRLGVTAQGIAFSGPARVEARDSRALVGWLTDRTDAAQIPASGLLRAQGDVKLGSGTIAVDALKAELDRMTVDGRLAYSWPSGEEPPRMEAVLNAPDLDLDRGYALVQGLFADAGFQWPRAGAFSVKVDRASIAGVEAKRTDIAMHFDRQGLEIERFAVGDLGGAAVSVKGRIDAHGPSPRGTLALDLDASTLTGVTMLLQKFAPAAAAELRRRAAQFVPAKVLATLSVGADPARPPGAPALATLKINGSAGTLRIDLQGRAAATSDALAMANLPGLASTKTSFTGKLEASDGSALIDLLGLDRVVAVDKRAARLNLSANGPPDGDMTVDGQLVAGGLDVSTRGSVRLAGNDGPAADLSVKVAAANVRSPRSSETGAPSGTTLTTALSGRLALAEGSVMLSDLAGSVADVHIGGRLKIGLTHPATLDGDIELDELNLPAAIAAAIGIPVQAAPSTAPRGAPVVLARWPAEPFEQGLLGRLNGRIVLNVRHVSLTPGLAAKNVRCVVRFEPSTLALDEIDGTIAGGRLAADMTFERGGEGITARSHMRFAGADIAELIRGGPPPLSGRLTFNVDLEGSGRSPVAVIGSLSGAGTFTMQDGRILRLDPAAFEAVIHSVDQGLPIDVNRIRDRMDQALGVGSIAIPLAEGQIVVAGGQALLGNAAVRAEGAELALAGNVALADDLIDVKMTLSGPKRADAPSGARPEIDIALKGPIDAPKRTLDVAAFTNWLALRSVEQQTKRIHALEADHSAQQPGDAAPSVPATNAPRTGAPTPMTGAPMTGAPKTGAPMTGLPKTGAPSNSSGGAGTVPRRALRTPDAPPRPRATVQPSPPAAGQAPLDIRAPAATRPSRLDAPYR